MPHEDGKIEDEENIELGSINPLDDTSCDPTDKFWSLYLKQTNKTDRDMVEDWKGTTDGTLIFAGLFSAVVTAFIIESYKNLQPQTDDLTLLAITQLSLQLASITVNGTGSNNSSPVPAFSTDLTHFKPTKTATWVNIFWFTSLFFSLTCALTATLVQQWSREYIQSIERYQVPRKRGQVRAHLYQGLTLYKMSGFMDAIPALLHVSLFTFFAGLFMMIHPINTTVGVVLFCLFLFGTALYLFTSITALFYHSYPFSTPLSQWFLRLSKIWRHNKKHTGKLSRLREEDAKNNKGALFEAYSYVLLVANEDKEFDELLEVLPEFYVSQKQTNPVILNRLLDDFYRSQGLRLKQLLDAARISHSPKRDKKIDHFLNFMYTAARLTALPSGQISDILTKWADTCSSDYLDEENQHISNIAFAVVAHATSCTNDKFLLNKPECDLTISQALDILSPLREYELPSMSETDPQSTRPFEYIFSCFQQYSKLRRISPHVYHSMIRSTNLGMEVAFVEIASIFLAEIYRHPFNSTTKEISEMICTFLCHLGDKAALKYAITVLDEFSQNHYDQRVPSGIKNCLQRLHDLTQRAKKHESTSSESSTLSGDSQESHWESPTPASAFGNGATNHAVESGQRPNFSNEPSLVQMSTSGSPPSISVQAPQKRTPARTDFGQSRTTEQSPTPPLRVSRSSRVASARRQPPSLPHQGALDTGPLLSSEHPHSHSREDISAGLTTLPGPSQPQYMPSSNGSANSMSRLDATSRPSSRMSYGSGETYVPDEDDEEGTSHETAFLKRR